MQEPENWEFLYWSNENNVYVFVPADTLNQGLVVVTIRDEPFFSVVKAAHPYHERTDAEYSRYLEIMKPVIIAENKRDLRRSINAVSQSVDNPTHWNRLAPEIKSQMQTHYREILKLREHETFSSGNINTSMPTMPEADVLEDQDSTPHRENAFLLPAQTPLKRGDILVRLPTCLLYTSPSPRDRQKSRMPSSA